MFMPFVISDFNKLSNGNNIFVFSGSKGQGKSYFIQVYSKNLSIYGANNVIINRNHRASLEKLLDKKGKMKDVTMLFIDGIEHLVMETSYHSVAVFELIKSLSMEANYPIIISVRNVNKISPHISSFTSIDFDVIDFIDVFDIVNYMMKDIEIQNISDRRDAIYSISEELYNRYTHRYEIVNVLREILNISYEQFVYENKDVDNPALKLDYYLIKNVISK
ncbi:MAG: hypothetical protein QXS19_09025 [Candidatus Methanomethylicia archaeon]